MTKDFDTSRLRSSFGFDQLIQAIDAAMSSADQGYPPYDIEKVGEDGYVLQMAVAGFTAQDLEITTENGQLAVVGKIAKDPEATTERNFVHRGISRRAFRRVFTMTDYIEVTGSKLENGLLSIELKRNVPEVAKKKVIPVVAGA